MLELGVATLGGAEVEEDTNAALPVAVLLAEELGVIKLTLDSGALELTARLLELEGTIKVELLELGTTATVELLDAEPRAGGSHIAMELVVLSVELEETTLEGPASLAAEEVLVLDPELATFEETGASVDDRDVKVLLLLAEDCTVVEPRAGGSHIEVEEEEEDAWIDTEEL